MEVEPYLRVMRVKFLTLSIVVGLAGVGLSYYEGLFSPLHSIIGITTLILLHISVNALNAASDYRTGIDANTNKTDFSGGIESIVNGEISYNKAKIIGTSTILLCIFPFIYFTLKHDPIPLLIISITGLVTIIGYTDLFARIGLGELTAGIGLGSMPILGIFYIQNGTITTTSLYFSAILFVPVFNLLLLNEYPDINVDKEHGRLNIPIQLGKKLGLTIYFVAVLALTLGFIYGIIYMNTPTLTVLSIIPSIILIPMLTKLTDEEIQITEKDLKLNVLWVHLTYLFTCISFITVTII